MKTINTLLLFFLFATPFLIFAGEIKLEGKVRDLNTHREISGVNIYIPGANAGATSSSSGRYLLTVPDPTPEMTVIFEHIAYDTLKLPLKEVSSQKNIYLQERIIPFPAVEITEEGERLEIEKDLPQTISVLEAQNFELKGYVDAGDLLRTDHSVQVNEELSGQKTVSIRGGNPDEVIVLYNGVKMNSALDNVFDISLIDMEDVKRFEVIKGSNTTLYGPEAFSGVINIVPKFRQDYNVRFHQRIGSYDSGNWGLHLYKNFRRLSGSYSIKKGGARRKFAGEAEGRQLLENLSEHHTATLGYSFSQTPAGLVKSSLGLMYLRSKLDYENERDNESLSNFNQMVTARFEGDIGPLPGISMSSAYQWLDEEQFLNFIDSAATGTEPNFLDRKIDNRTFHLNLEKTLQLNPLELLFAYQYKNSRLYFKDQRIVSGELPVGLESADMSRQHHGFIAIGKYHAPGGSSFLSSMDFNLSFRFDHVTTRFFGSRETKPQIQAVIFPRMSGMRPSLKCPPFYRGVRKTWRLRPT
jgi:outer membrane receptor protein involved in Fe transport